MLRTPNVLPVTTLFATVTQAVQLPAPLPPSAGLRINVLLRANVLVDPKAGPDSLKMPSTLSLTRLLIIVTEAMTPELNAALAAYRQLAAKYDFAGAAAVIREANLTEPSLKQA